MSDRHRMEFGQEGERLAEDFLIGQGLAVIDRNVRCGRIGEIDLVARDGDNLVFVEVRRRSSDLFGGAKSSLGSKKRTNIRRAAEVYLLQHAYQGDCRFDLVSIDGGSISWHKDVLR